MPTAPDIAISIDAAPHLKLTLQNLHGDLLHVETNLTHYQLPNFRQRFYASLEAVKNYWAQTALYTDEQHTISGLLGLVDKTSEYTFELLGPSYLKIRDFLNDTLKNWHLVKGPNEKVPLIEIRSFDNYMLPLELLPLLGNARPSGIFNLPELQLVASQFLGFSAIIKKVFMNQYQSSNTLLGEEIDNSEKLRLRYFRYEDIPSANLEEAHLKKMRNIEFRGPWPDRELPQAEFEQKLIDLIFYAREQKGDPVDHIQHFYCHCDTDPNDANDHSLILGHKQKGFFVFRNFIKRSVRLGKLNARFLGLQRPPADYPLVFLNACGSARLKLNGPTSFPQALLMLQNRGVIGTEASIPESFANRFSQRFYELWLQRKPLGEAIYHAKWDMVKRYNNYLGILYAVYANTDLKLAIPVDVQN